MIIVNSRWLKPNYWEVFPKDVTLDMLNLKSELYNIILYNLENGKKSFKILKF